MIKQIVIWTVLSLPTIFAIIEGILFCKLPIKSDFTELNVLIWFVLVCLSFLAMCIMGVVLSLKADNCNFDGFGIKARGVVAMMCALVATFCFSILSFMHNPYYLAGCEGAVIAYIFEIWQRIFKWGGFIASLFFLACFVAFIIEVKKHGKLSLIRFVLCLLASISLGFSLGCYAFSTHSLYDDYYEENPDGTFTYVIRRDNTEILSIPLEHKGYPVTRIERAYGNEYNGYAPTENLKTVIISDSVIEIADNAFCKSPNLKSITIGNGVTSIKAYAFYGCTSLESVTFNNPNSWYYTLDPSATSGTYIPVENLQNPTTAASFLKEYCHYYWKCEKN